MNRYAVLIFAIAMLLAAALPAAASASGSGSIHSYADLFSGKTYPLTMKLSDLSPDWKRVEIAGQGADASNYVMLYSTAITGQQTVTYTRGDTVTIGSETFLVTYRIKPKPVDYEALEHMNRPPKPVLPTPDTPLTLTIVNVRALTSLSQIAPFDLATETAAAPAPKPAESPADIDAENSQSDSNLKQLSIGIIQYVQDYDEMYPPMKSIKKFKEVTYPYEKSDAVYIDPVSKQPYVCNPRWSGKNVAKMPTPAQEVMMWEPEMHPDQTRAVAFADGHVKRIKEDEWVKLQQAYRLQWPGP